MIIWAIFIPGIALLSILYFQYMDTIFNGRKAIYKINSYQNDKPSFFEWRNTIINLFIFFLVGGFVGYAIEQGWTNTYTEKSEGLVDILYMVVSFFITLLLHDFYFYISHRFLHTKFLFKRIHYWHHQSHEPNVWSTFSFHPVEGIIQIGIVPLLAFLLPIHQVALFSFTAFLLFMSTYGHAAYELRANKAGVLHIFNTALHHYQHHQYVRYNFGIYLNLWDKLFKTNHPTYKETVIDFNTRISVSKQKENQ